ncbi:MAG: hypothetical protein CMJ78_11320 [Planctomycetaceae bacterium]|nr:hypothetical protein [Planctomycetaceae bacterium]
MVETYLDPDTFWIDPLPYSGDSQGTLYSGTSSTIPTSDEFREGIAQIEEFKPGQRVTFWLYNNAIFPGDVHRYTCIDPDGDIFQQRSFTQSNFFKSRVNHVSIDLPVDATLGEWTATFESSGRLFATETFMVTTTGAPEIRVEQDVPGEENQAYIIDERYTPIDFGEVQQNGSAPTQSFIVKNNGSDTLTLGAITVAAGYSVTDGLPSSLAPGATDVLPVQAADRKNNV